MYYRITRQGIERSIGTEMEMNNAQILRITAVISLYVPNHPNY